MRAIHKEPAGYALEALPLAFISTGLLLVWLGSW